MDLIADDFAGAVGICDQLVVGSPGDLLDIVVELGGTLAHVWLLEGVVGL